MASSSIMNDSKNQRSRSFAQATFSYEGSREYEQVEAFLTAAKKYKSMKNIGDIDAIRSIPLVLKGEAANWWNGIKDKIATWKEFESKLRNTFAPIKPGYVIFQEIAEMKQRPDELTERFVAKQRALLNQLPSPGFTEVQQLDLMYGFLNSRIRDHIPRECIESFDGLLEAARGIEQENLKDNADPNKPKAVGRKRVRCNFCRNFGHVAESCRKRQKVIAENLATSTESNTDSSTEVPAAAPPVLTPSDVKENEDVNSAIFCDVRPRPMIEISIGTAKELAYVDSGATTSLASYKLYSYLKNIGFHFQEENTTITMADGFPKTRDILTGRIPVKLYDRCILTTFIVLPEARDTETLLGIGFIKDADIILNLPQLTWNFRDEPNGHHDLIMEKS